MELELAESLHQLSIRQQQTHLDNLRLVVCHMTGLCPFALLLTVSAFFCQSEAEAHVARIHSLEAEAERQIGRLQDATYKLEVSFDFAFILFSSLILCFFLTSPKERDQSYFQLQEEFEQLQMQLRKQADMINMIHSMLCLHLLIYFPGSCKCRSERTRC